MSIFVLSYILLFNEKIKSKRTFLYLLIGLNLFIDGNAVYYSGPKSQNSHQNTKQSYQYIFNVLSFQRQHFFSALHTRQSAVSCFHMKFKNHWDKFVLNHNCYSNFGFRIFLNQSDISTQNYKFWLRPPNTNSTDRNFKQFNWHTYTWLSAFTANRIHCRTVRWRSCTEACVLFHLTIFECLICVFRVVFRIICVSFLYSFELFKFLGKSKRSAERHL